VGKKKCWYISYFYTVAGKKTIHRVEFYGCHPGDSRKDAIERARKDIRLEPGETLVRVSARPSPKGHYCFTHGMPGK
jgi:hypothetical protein